MTHDSWRVIPKGAHRSRLTLKVEVNARGYRRFRLCIPLRLRRGSEYFEDCALMHCDLLERGPLVMLQFIPEEAATEDSHVIHHGQLYLARDVLKIEASLKGRYRVPHKIEGGNIVIDRRDLGNMEEVG